MRCRRCGAPIEESDLKYAAAWNQVKAVRLNSRNSFWKDAKPVCRDCYEREVRATEWEVNCWKEDWQGPCKWTRAM